MKITVHNDNKTLLLQAAQELQSIFEQNNNQPILFLSSGGSSFEILNHIKSIPLNLSIGVVDERYSTDPQINNFSQLEQTDFYKNNEARFAQILDTKVQHEESLEEFTKRYEELLRNWEKANPNGIITATLGVGPDGHISGINPEASLEAFNNIFDDESKWVVGYESSLTPSLRATTTFPFLRQIDYAVTLMTGENKKDALRKIKGKQGTLSETPGRILRELKQATIFTDITL